MKKQKLFHIVLMALYIALLLVMDFTPIGYIPTGLFNITLMFLPVIFGAITLGPIHGAILGAVFGATSFIQAFGLGFVVDPMAGTLFNENPVGYTLVCFLPRIIMGLAVGLIFKGLQKIDKTRLISYGVASASAVVFNTSLFLTGYFLVYKNTVLAGTTFKAIITTALTLNSLIELLVALVVGTAVSKAIAHALSKIKA